MCFLYKQRMKLFNNILYPSKSKPKDKTRLAQLISHIHIVPSVRINAAQSTRSIQTYDVTAWSSINTRNRYVLVHHLVHNSTTL